MGFFETMKRMIEGKPLFDTEDQRQAKQTIPKEGYAEQAQTSNNGRKNIPLIRVEHTECHNNGDTMTVRAEIRNESSELVVELDKIRLLGAVRELDTRLRPGEAREFILYSGRRPNNRSYGVAELNYKDLLGDYFQARCAVEFRAEPDNTFSIQRVKVAGPIKDIQ